MNIELLIISHIIYNFRKKISAIYRKQWRKYEIEADKYAIEITSDAKTNGDLEIKFINTNLTPVNPTGLYKWLAYDHPTAKERIELSNEMNKN